MSAAAAPSPNGAASQDAWLAGNNAYIAASLRWLRARLNLAAVPPPAQAAPPPRRFVLGPARRGSAIRGRPVLAALPSPDLHAEAEQASVAREDAARLDPAPALVLLERRLGLTAFERDVLLLCTAAELDPGVSALFAGARGWTPGSAPAGTPAPAYPSFALALQALPDPSWEALSPHRPLRYARLIEVTRSGAAPMTSSPLRADERIVGYIKGLNALDERVAAAALPIPADPPARLSASQQAVADDILRQLRAAGDAARVPAVQLVGADASSKLAVARQVSNALGRRLHRLALDAIPAGKAEAEEFARLWSREAVLLPLALLVEADELDSANAEQVAALHRLAAHGLGLLFVSLREAPERGRSMGMTAEVDRPTPAEQHEAWAAALAPLVNGDQAGPAAEELAGQFDLNLDEIGQAAGAPAIDEAEADRRCDLIWDGCRALTRPRLAQLAERVEGRVDWDDLVVPDEAAALLRQIAAQVRCRYTVYERWGYAKKLTRGLGVTVLFSGESGTGKTMAAEVIAGELKLDLYRIDLSAVVSKYIGETEKNLRRLFDAAERGGAILFFDEADALFGKRSEVKDSHDRYANIEINYLLQRMESFSGLAILASNMKSALDPAFMRRLRFVVSFPFPGAGERKRIWRRALPADAPTEALDYDRLARFGLSGGNITSIALNAAFLAAKREQPVSMPLLLAATRTELRKLEKPINEAEFR